MEALWGESDAVCALRREIAALADAPSSVLVTGETGTGKGLVARALHSHSRRREEPFVHVDCASLSPGLIESELFGHERGAFTGAHDRRTGRFELARRGTLFLDEIAELDRPLQAKLLRVLQDREYERLGGARVLRLRARVVAATSCELERAVAEGRFRADLFYRLDVVRLRLPPLRARPGDVEVLVREGLRRLEARFDRRAPTLGPGVLDRLSEHGWPGNVRELLNFLERVMVWLPGGELDAAALSRMLEPSPRSLSVRGFTPARVTPEDARARIEAALAASGGNVAKAARTLGIPRSTLRYRLGRGGGASLGGAR